MRKFTLLLALLLLVTFAFMSGCRSARRSGGGSYTAGSSGGYVPSGGSGYR